MSIDAGFRERPVVGKAGEGPPVPLPDTPTPDAKRL